MASPGTLNDKDNPVQKQYDEAESLKNAEEGLKGSTFESQSEGFNEQFAGQPKNQTSGEQLKNAEQSGAGAAPDDSSNPLNFTGGGGGKPKGLKSKIKAVGGLVSRNRSKFYWGGGIAGGLVTLAALISQIGTLLLPTLSFNIQEDRYKHIGRIIGNHTDSIVKTKMVIDATNDANYVRALQEYADGRPGSGLFKKINDLRPVKLAENLLLDSEFDTSTYTIPRTNLKRTKLLSITYDGQKVEVPQNNFNPAQRMRHPITYWNQISPFGVFKKTSRAAATTYLEKTGPGELSKFQRVVQISQLAKQIRRSIDVETWHWTKAQVDEAAQDPKTRGENASNSYKENYERGKDQRPSLSGDAQEIAEANDACVDSDGCRNRMINDESSLSPQASEIINTNLTPSAIRSALGSLSNANTIVAIVCAIARTSIQASEEIINYKAALAINHATQVSAAADQQTYTQLSGDARVDAGLTGGYNDQVNQDGTAIESVPLRRGDGEQYTTAETLSPEAGGIGMFGTDSEGFLGSAIAGSIGNFAGGAVCDVATHWGTQVVLAVGEFATAFISGGGTAIASQTAGRAIVSRTLNALSTVLKGQITRNAIIQNAALLTLEQGANVLTYIAQAQAMEQAGVTYSGMAGGAEYINQADAGATVMAQYEAQGYGGAPLTTEAYMGVNESDQEFIQQTAGDMSVSQRYFAINHPKSLLNKMAINFYSNMRLQSWGSTIQNLASNLNPMALFSNLSSLSSVSAAPGDNPELLMIEREYGTVQYGWSNDEEDAYLYNDGYAPLYNEKVLDESDQKEDLMEKYGKCFDPVENPIGTTLAKEWVHRDENANVIADKGDCAPNKLGDDIPNDGRITFANDEAGMVFRLRISIRNNRAVDDLLGIQDPVQSISPQEAVGQNEE